MFDIHLTNYNGEKNRINKNVSFLVKLQGTLRESSDVVNPSILVESPVDAICGFNYAYIPVFKRYYYITNCTAYRDNLTVITMSVDVLFTYKETILNSPAIIVRSSKTTDSSSPDLKDLPDDRFPLKQSETTHTITFDSLYDTDAQAGKGQTAIIIMTGIDNPSP